MLCWLSTSVPSQSNTTSRNARAPAPEFMSWAPWDANITHPERKAPRRAAGRGPAFGTKSHAQEMVIPSAPCPEGSGTPFGAQGGSAGPLDGAGGAMLDARDSGPQGATDGEEKMG